MVTARHLTVSVTTSAEVGSLFGRCSAVIVTVLLAATDPFFVSLFVLSY
jgi:hypothetical protein